MMLAYIEPSTMYTVNVVLILAVYSVGYGMRSDIVKECNIMTVIPIETNDSLRNLGQTLKSFETSDTNTFHVNHHETFKPFRISLYLSATFDTLHKNQNLFLNALKPEPTFMWIITIFAVYLGISAHPVFPDATLYCSSMAETLRSSWATSETEHHPLSVEAVSL
jgi:hypothetical protein